MHIFRNHPNFILPVLVLGLLAAPVRAAVTVISLDRPMTAVDPNRDPNWDWTVNTTYPLYIAGVSPTPVERLPYYASTGPAAADLNVSGDRDIEPSQGWELILRDFGVAGAPTSMPFFILYNRFRGTLRFFYWSTLAQSFSFASGKLTFQSSSSLATTAAHMTFADADEQAFADEYNPEKSQVVVGKVGWHQWSYFDFDVSGYDPSLTGKDDPTFIIEVVGVTQSQIVLSGTLNLESGTTTTHKQEPGNGVVNLVGGTIEAYQKVAKRYKDINDAKKQYDDMAAKNGEKWWGKILKGIGGLAAKDWIPALAPVVGFAELIFGGGSSSSRLPAPLVFEGTVELNGNMTTEGFLLSKTLRVPGSNHLDPANDAASNVLPLYDQPLGVFNLETRPRVGHYVVREDVWCYDPPWWVQHSYEVERHQQLLEPIRYVVNPAAGLTITSIEAAYLPADAPPEGYVEGVSDGYSDLVTFPQVEIVDLNDPDPTYCDQLPAFPLERRRVGIRVRLEPMNPIPGFEPVTLIKAYTPSYEKSVPPSFTLTECVGVSYMLESLGLSQATCAAYCTFLGKSCVESCTTNRGYPSWGVEAWVTTEQCEAYSTSGGQARCTTNLAGYSYYQRRKYRCCCSPL